MDSESDSLFGQRLQVGNCPECHTILAGVSTQLEFGMIDAEFDRWSAATRVYPRPAKQFTSAVPRTVRISLEEADKTLQAGANIAACVMLGRALEALCRHALTRDARTEAAANIMLGRGIDELRQRGVIDERLYAWSQELRAFRNLAAHGSDAEISRTDAEDLHVFVCAIVEYVYDLADRYEEFRSRQQQRRRSTPP